MHTQKSTFASRRSPTALAVLLSLCFAGGCGGGETDSSSASATPGPDEPAQPSSPSPTEPEATSPSPSGPDSVAPTPTDNTPTAPLPTEPTTADASLPLIGSFLVSLVPPVESSGTPGFTSVQGSINDGAPLELTVWSHADDDPASGCELLTPSTPTCTDGCGTGSACVADETCKEHPVSRSLGEVKIIGLQTGDGLNELVMNPQKPKLNYNKPAATDVLFPPAAEGDLIVLTAAGGDYEPVQMAATGISPLEVLGPTTIPITGEEPLKLEWVAAGAGVSRIDIKIDISHHGGAKGKILCQVDDTGSLEIPASLTKGLIDLGFSGYPTIIVTRKGIGAAAVGPGRVELRLESMVERPLSIPGLTSCDSDAQCTEAGQVCLKDRRCGTP